MNTLVVDRISTESIISKMGASHLLPLNPYMRAFDIETDNSQGHGLDPRRAPITQLAFATPTTTWVYSGEEVDLLIAFIKQMKTCVPGFNTVYGWNNTGFDEPFIAVRLEENLPALRARGYFQGEFKMENIVESLPENQPKYSVAGGFDHPQRLRWNDSIAMTYDICYEWKKTCQEREVSWSLKPLLQHLGYEPVELDRTALHGYSHKERTAYNASDAVGVLVLASHMHS